LRNLRPGGRENPHIFVKQKRRPHSPVLPKTSARRRFGGDAKQGHELA
jgi:hypothetical protein